ncbi:MAG: ATP-dependent helicase [Anaerolineae bacterium]
MALKLRHAQEEILKYQGGLLAISAVPGSGKTFILSVLAAELIATQLEAFDSAVLLVTYQRSAVDNLKQQVGQRLRDRGLPNAGYEVRTLHSLGYEIVRMQPALAGVAPEFEVADERRAAHMLETASRLWIEANPDRWQTLVAGLGDPSAQARSREIAQEVARGVIRLAKNLRHRPAEIRDRLAALDPEEADQFFLLDMAIGIYELYETQLQTSGLLDFDDLVSRAATVLAQHPDVADRLRERWPFVLEDEAQDSTPLQEEMLSRIACLPDRQAGPQGNWVRVGDPNQAIMGTFTASDPAYFRRFLARDDIVRRELPNSGRSSQRIIDLANHLVRWASEEHPVPEVRARAFRLQAIEPTPAGDPQPNPDNRTSRIVMRGYADLDAELDDVARRAVRYAGGHPEDTVAILVPTNWIGYQVSDRLKDVQAPYVELLRASASSRGVARTLASLIRYLGEPLSRRNLVEVYAALVDYAGIRPQGPRHARITALLNSVQRPECLVYPESDQSILDALPPIPGGLSAREQQTLERMQAVLAEGFKAVTMPVDELVMTLAQQRFDKPSELAVAHRVAMHMRRLHDANPEWRLPRLADELYAVAEGELQLPGLDEQELGFEPAPGEITLTTLHKAKGLEWDLVYIVSVTPFDFPGTPDDVVLGYHEGLGNPVEEAGAQLRGLMGHAGERQASQPVRLPVPARQTRRASDLAKLELIAERLRLLYVGITRARRYLFVSWSRGGKGLREGKAIALEELERFVRMESGKWRMENGR